MGANTCPSCAGTGGYMETEKVPSAQGGMFDYVQVRKTCATCAGSGTVFVSGNPGTPGGGDVGARGAGSGQAPGQAVPFEDIAANILALVAGGWVIWFLLSAQDANLQEWVPWVAGFIIGGVVNVALKGPLRVLLTFTKNLLKLALWLAAIALVLMVLGQLAESDKTPAEVGNTRTLQCCDWA